MFLSPSSGSVKEELLFVCCNLVQTEAAVEQIDLTFSHVNS